MAILHPEGRDEEPDGDRVHRDAEDLVECTQPAVVNLLFLFVCEHRVDNDVERDEQTPLGEQEDQEKTADVSVVKFVDYQVGNDGSLHDKQRLLLAPAWNDLVVGPNSDDHVNGHHESLEDYPALLGTIAERTRVLIVVELCLFDPGRVFFIERIPHLLRRCKVDICRN